MKRRHFTHFAIAGFTYYDGSMAFGELKIGSPLQLVYEPTNKYDPKAVIVKFNDFKLGYIPCGENNEISKLLEMGYTNIFDVRIQRLDPTEHPEQQVSVIVYLKKAEVDSK